MRTACLVGVLVMWMAAPAFAQQPPRVDVAGGYAFLRDVDLEADFHGWVASVGVNLTSWLGLVGEVGGHYMMLDFLGTDVSLSSHAFLGGARVSVRRGSRVSPFGQVLVGAMHGRVSGFGESASGTKLALQPGGGLDVWLRPTVGVRVGGDYRRVFVDGREGLDEVRIHVGVVLAFGR